MSHMLHALTDLPDRVIGFEAEGDIEADDYSGLLVPAIEQQIADHDQVRIVLVFPEGSGYSGGGAWEDLKLGAKHLTKWERVALVSDVDWISHLVTIFGWMMPGEVKRFPMAERDAAVAWAAG